MSAKDEEKQRSAHFAALPADRRAALEALRAAIRSAAPEATEGISYQMPAFKVGGKGIVCYDAFKDHYSLFPMSGQPFEELGDALKPYRAGKGTIRFEYGERLPVALVKKIVKIRLAQVVSRTKR